MTNPRLLTPEETEIAINKWKNEDWATRHIRLERGHYEDILPVITQTQDIKSVKAIYDQLDTMVKTGHFNRLVFEGFMLTLKRGI